MSALSRPKLAVGLLVLSMAVLVTCIIWTSRQSARAGSGVGAAPSNHVRQVEEATRQAEKMLGGGAGRTR